MDNLPTIRNLYRRSAGLNFFRATLGDENGVIDEPGRAGYVRIRYTQAAGLGKATTVRFRAVVQKTVGMPVEVGYDTDGELAVLRADFAAQEATGINPLGNNPADDNVSYFVNQSQITTALCHPVSSAADSMLVTVEPVLYVLDGTLHFFLGGDGDGATPIDLTASIPGTANKQCAACLFLDVTTDTIEVQTSTPIDITDDLTTADVQECITASTAGSLPIHAWRLYNGQTGINPTDIPSGGDNFLDLRQLINVITDNATAGMTSFNAAGDSGTPQAITNGNTLTIAGGTGLSSVASATDTVTVNLDDTVVTPGAYTNASLTVDQQGRLTAASSGTAPVTAVTASPPLASSGGTTPDISLGDITTKIIFDEWAESGTPSANTLWVYSADDNGFTIWRQIDSTGTILQTIRDQVVIAKNVTGASIAAGSAVKLTTVSASAPAMVKAIATNTHVNLADGVVMETTADTAFGRVMVYGIMPYDTSGFSAGATLYLSAATAGVLTATPPTQSAGWAQVVAFALDSSVSGHIFIDRKGAVFPQIYLSDLNIGKGSATSINFATDATHFLSLTAPVITANRIVNLPADVNTTLVGRDTTDSLTNKKYGSGASVAADAVLDMVSTTLGGRPAPVMTAAQRDAISSPATGLQVVSSNDYETYLYDSQRYRGVGAIGWLPFAFQKYPPFFGTVTVGTTALPANGGSAAFPVWLEAHMLVQSVTIRNNDTATARTWGWDLYIQDLNNGNAGENTLRRVIASNGNQSFTPTVGSQRTLDAASAPVYLPPGLYWLVIQNRHATSTFGMQTITSANAWLSTINWAQQATTTSPNGSTLDFVTGWTKNDIFWSARLDGRIFGQTAMF